MLVLQAAVTLWSSVRFRLWFRGWHVWILQLPGQLLHLEFSPRTGVCFVAGVEADPLSHLLSYIMISVLAFQACIAELH